ncbi:MAG TPA: caspase family protein, partial [Myxococcota bacterium]|nr:caspase family protein [Myxococcota bacterium]
MFALFALTGLRQAAAGTSSLPARAAPPAQFALVVGYNGTQNPAAAPLRYADDDAVSTHRLLQEAGVQAVLLTELDQDSQALYPDVQVDGAPTLAAILAHFSTLRTAMETARRHAHEVHFTFVYSGHGDVQNGVGYVELSEGRLTRTKLYSQILARSPATFNHVIVDACKAYFLAFDRGPGGRRAPVHGMLPTHAEALRHTGFILSTSSGGDTHEWS